MQKEVIPEQDHEGSFWTYEGGKSRRLREISWRVVPYFIHIAKYVFVLLGKSKLTEYFSRGMWHAWEKSEMCRGYWWGNLKERDHLEYVEIYVNMILTFMLKNWDERFWTGFVLVRICTIRRMMWTSFGFLLNAGNSMTDRGVFSFLARILFDELVSVSN